MNIPMYGAIKRCTPIVSLALSVLILKKAAPSQTVVLSVLVITFGIIIASVGDQLVIFDKTALIKEQIYALACSQLMISMLFIDTGLAAADERLLFDFVETLSESFSTAGAEIGKS